MLFSFFFIPLQLALAAPFNEGEAIVNHLRYQFESNYAPKSVKEGAFGWNLDEEIDLLQDALKTHDIKVWRKALKEFFNSSQDAHVQVRFQSTSLSTLPFELREAEERYFVVQVHSEGDAENKLKVGDEILSWNGEAIDMVVHSYIEKEFARASHERSSFEIAMLYFTLRDGELGLEPETGDVELEVLRGGQKFTATFKWRLYPELFPFAISKAAIDHRLEGRRTTSSAFDQLIRLESLLPHCNTRLEAKEKKDKKKNPFRMGVKQSFVPNLGSIIWQAWERDPYKAYLFELADGEKVGYIRIPHFKFDRDSDFHALGRTIRKLKDGGAAMLVIDLLHNPGGLLLNMYAVVSLFIDEPIEALSHFEVLSSGQIDLALKVKGELAKLKGNEIDLEAKKSYFGYPADDRFSEGLKRYADFILEEANLGSKVSDSFPILGIEKIYPNPKIRYAGPLLILIDSLDFSCADFFPAILKDAGRARLLGAKTGGAGGIVSTGLSFQNRFGIEEFQLTSSVATRPMGAIIEGIGVEPDAYYEPTAEDYLQNFEPFKERILEEIEEILRSSGVEPETFGSGGQRSIH